MVQIMAWYQTIIWTNDDLNELNDLNTIVGEKGYVWVHMLGAGDEAADGRSDPCRVQSMHHNECIIILHIILIT